MQLEIFGRGIKITHKKERGHNLPLTITKAVKNNIYFDLRNGVFEGSISQNNRIVGSWKAQTVGENRLVR